MAKRLEALDQGPHTRKPLAQAAVLATKAKRQVRVFSVLIDLPDRSSGSPSDRTLVQFSDEVLRLTDLAQESAVLGRLFGRS